MGKLLKNFVSATLVKIGVGAVFVFGLAACDPCAFNPDRCPDTTTGSGSTGGEVPDDNCFDYMKFDGATKMESFKADVLPILRTSCSANTACHVNESGKDSKPYLGPSTTTATSTLIGIIRTQNVGVEATKASMKLVDPEHPETSFWMHKMDNTLTCSDVVCKGDCGVAMPKDAPQLSQAQRDTVRRWILQGALDN